MFHQIILLFVEIKVIQWCYFKFPNTCESGNFLKKWPSCFCFSWMWGFFLFHIKNDLLHFPPKVWESEQWIMQRENRPPFTTQRLLSTDWKGKAKSKSLHNTNSILFHRCCAILMMIAVEKLIIWRIETETTFKRIMGFFNVKLS